MHNDPALFPDLNLPHLQKWAVDFVNDHYPSAGISEVTLHEFKRKIKGRSAIPGANHLQSTPFEYMAVIHLRGTDFQANQRNALKKAVHGPLIWDETSYLAVGVDAKFKGCFNRLSPGKSNEAFLQAIGALTFWVFSPNDDETQGDGFGWPPHVDRDAPFWRLYPHRINYAPFTPVFPFHIDILKRQINRWIQEFGLTLQQAFLCSVNLQREFKEANRDSGYPILKYALVLIAEHFSESFLRIVKRVEGPLDDDFVTAYTQLAQAHWRFEWHIEPCIDESEISSVIEFDESKINLLETLVGEVNKIPNGTLSPQEFLLSNRIILDRILSVTRDFLGDDAFNKAILYLKNNPSDKLLPEYLSAECFTGNDPLRDYRGKVAQAMLKFNDFPSLSIAEIKKILSKKS